MKKIFTVAIIPIVLFGLLFIAAAPAEYDYDTWVRDEQLRQATIEYDYDTWTRPDVKMLIEQER